jgi:hypothetical protein
MELPSPAMRGNVVTDGSRGAHRTTRKLGGTMIKRIVIVAAVVGAIFGGTAAPAFADPPGPGDKQCVPGQHGNPHPGFKAGACDNP